MIALTIAGSDSGGGAGIQADLKTFSALGVYGASVLTAVTAQNTRGVTAVHPIPTDIVLAQLDAVLTDLSVDAIKIGMLGDAGLIEALAERLAAEPTPVVLDTVMVSASGHRLVPEEAMEAIKHHLLPVASLITPNIPEAAALTGEAPAETEAELARQAHTLAATGRAVLVKGGHMGGDESVDILVAGGREERFSAPRTATRNTHGTGCTLSSAVAAYMARGVPLFEAVGQAKAFVTGAIRAADTLKIGGGYGPVHHFHEWWGKTPGTAPLRPAND